MVYFVGMKDKEATVCTHREVSCRGRGYNCVYCGEDWETLAELQLARDEAEEWNAQLEQGSGDSKQVIE
jgi:hypothetical protein